MANMGHKRLDYLDLPGFPATRFDGVHKTPEDAGSIRPVQTRIQGVLGTGTAQGLVVSGRRFQFLFGVEVGDMDYLVAWQPPKTRRAFIEWIVVLQIILQHLIARLTPVKESSEENLGIPSDPLDDDQGISRRAAGVVNQGRSHRPMTVVQSCFVQRLQDAMESGLLAQDRLSPAARDVHSHHHFPKVLSSIHPFGSIERSVSSGVVNDFLLASTADRARQRRFRNLQSWFGPLILRSCRKNALKMLGHKGVPDERLVPVLPGIDGDEPIRLAVTPSSGLGCIPFRQAIALKKRRCFATKARVFSLPPIRRTEKKEMAM